MRGQTFQDINKFLDACTLINPPTVIAAAVDRMNNLFVFTLTFNTKTTGEMFQPKTKRDGAGPSLCKLNF